MIASLYVHVGSHSVRNTYINCNSQGTTAGKSIAEALETPQYFSNPEKQILRALFFYLNGLFSEYCSYKTM